MSPNRKTLIWVAGGVIAGTALVFGVRSLMPGDAAPATDPAVAAPATADEAPAPAASAGNTGTTDRQPWEQSGMGAPTALPTPRQALPTAPSAGPSIARQLTQSASMIRAQSAQNQRAADELLGKLDELEKTAEPQAKAQVAALRNNILVAKRAQTLAVELVDLTEQPDSPQRQARTDAIIAELQSLQGKLAQDINPQMMIPPITAAPATPATGAPQAPSSAGGAQPEAGK